MPDPITPSPAESESSPRPRFRTPVEYYSTPGTEVRPLVSRKVPIGCGAVSAALLLLLFIAGAIVAHLGLGRFMDPLLGTMAGELPAMYTSDVTPASRTAVAAELTRLRENVRSGKLPVARLDPVMSALRKVIADQKITPAESDEILQKIRAANTAPEGRKDAPQKGSRPSGARSR